LGKSLSGGPDGRQLWHHPAGDVARDPADGAGVIDVEQVISHRFPLTEIHKALEVMESPERNKVIINP